MPRQTIPETTAGFDHTQIIERPDGIYWRERDSGAVYGPFPTIVEAVADMEANDVSEPVTAEDVVEAERELGIPEWVDPETGELAEDHAPHIDDADH